MKHPKKIKIISEPESIKISIRAWRIERWGKQAMVFALMNTTLVISMGVILRGMGDESISAFFLLIFSLCCFIVFFYIVGQANEIEYTDTLRIFRENLSIQHGRWGTETSYALGNIQNIRLHSYETGSIKDTKALPDSKKQQQRGTILFNDKTTTITCCQHVDVPEGTFLVKYLEDIVRFRCHSIQCVIWGNIHCPVHDENHTLRNPDVTELTTPLYHLKHIIIHPKTYNSLINVEKFLTYLFNNMNKAYTKEHVDVDIYGDRATLHPNIYNNLSTLCKRVVVHEECTYVISA